MATTKLFEVECEGQTLIVTPHADLHEWDFREIDAGAQEVLRLLESDSIQNVVMDFHRTDMFGSTALGFFVVLWKRVRVRGGRLTFCGLSDHEREILQVTKLDKLWPLCASREEALRRIQENIDLD